MPKTSAAKIRDFATCATASRRALALTGAVAASLFAYGSLTTLPAHAQGKKVNWDMQSVYSGTLPINGTMGKQIAEQIAKVSDGSITLKFQEPGAIVPALETFDAVSSGAVQAGWGSPGFWTGKDITFALFAAVPFGPSAPEYMAWMKYGGGQELMRDLYGKHNIHSIPCAMHAPEASGWFRREITNVNELKGLKMRFFGLGARVMEKLGVSTQLLAAGDILPALELGTIDATEFSMPSADQALGFSRVAKYYYFPGWHQQSTFLDLMINADEWKKLSDNQRAQIEAVCDAAITRSLAQAEAIQGPALEKIKADGVQLKTWSPEILDAMRKAWSEVVQEEKQKNQTFAKAWDSFSTFREKYKTWGELGTVR